MAALTLRPIGRSTQGDHRQFTTAGQCTNLAAQRKATLWHIQQHGVEAVPLQCSERRRAAVHGFDPVTELEQHATHRQLAHAVVVHQQHRAFLRRTLCRQSLRGRRHLLRHRADVHFQLEAAAFTGLRMMGQAPAQQFDQLPANRQANAQAAVFTRHRAVQLKETLIQRGLIEKGKADTGVGDDKAQVQGPIPLRHAHHTQTNRADVGEFERIVEQAIQALTQLLGIADEPVWQLIRDVNGERQALGLGAAGELLAQGIELATQAEHLRLGHQATGLQLGEGEDAVDHAHHVPRRAGGGLLVLRQVIVQRHGLHQFQRADHTVHRRAQFVGQGGEKFVFEAIAASQLLVERFQLLAGIEENLRLLFAHAVDAVGQGQGQQRHFNG